MSYAELAGTVSSQASVRAYLEFVYNIDNDQMNMLLIKNMNKINHQGEMKSFAYWTGDSIINEYNQPFADEAMNLQAQLADARVNEDSVKVAELLAAIAATEAQMILPKEGVDTLDDVDEE